MWLHTLCIGINKRVKEYRNSIFEFSELTQVVSNCESKDIKHPLKICMYAQKLFNPAISTKTIRHVCPTLQNPIDYAQKIKKILLFEGIQQTKFGAVMLIEACTNKNSIRQQETCKHYMLQAWTKRSLQRMS